MNYSSADHDNLLDATLEILAEDQPIQIRTIASEDGIERYVVGHLDSAYHDTRRGTTNLVIGKVTLSIESDDTWEILVHRAEIGGAQPISAWLDEAERADVIVSLIPGERPGVHAMRWARGSRLGYADAVIVRRLAADAVLVRFAIDGHEQGVLYSEIRATAAEWEVIEKMK